MKKSLLKGILVIGLIAVTISVFALSGLLPKQKESKKSVEVKKEQIVAKNEKTQEKLSREKIISDKSKEETIKDIIIKGTNNNIYPHSLDDIEFMKKLKKEVWALYGWNRRKPNKYEKKIFDELNKCSQKGMIGEDFVFIFKNTKEAGIDLKNIIWPFADVIFDYDNKYHVLKIPKHQEYYYLDFLDLKESAVTQIGYTLKKEALPLLKKLLKVEINYKKNIIYDYHYYNSPEGLKELFKLKTIEGIYLCGDKKAAWEDMVKINRKGIAFIFGGDTGIKNGVIQYDHEIKPYLVQIVKMADDLVRINAADYLICFGEKDLAIKIAKEIENKKLTSKKRYDRNWSINYHLKRIYKKVKKNEK